MAAYQTLQLHYHLSPTTTPPLTAITHHTPHVKHEPTMADRVNAIPPRSSDDPMPSTSDFVKKLYKMLEDPAFQSVVSWGPQGDCFVVKDMNEFTKSILPRMFKHSNFASFVRQLNKYDFHKVKNTDDNHFGEHSWTFRHPDFHADRRDALENIKRKVPAARKNQQPSSTLPLSSHPYSSNRGRSTSPSSLGALQPHHLSSLSYPGSSVLQAEIHRLRDEGDDLRGRIRILERNYESVLVEMVAFQRGMAQQDGLMQNMISYFLGSQSGKSKTSQPIEDTSPQGFFPPTTNDPPPSVPPPPSSSSSSTIPRDLRPSLPPPPPPPPSSAVRQLQAQLREQQTHRERAHQALQTRLDQVTRERKRHEMSVLDLQDRSNSPVSQSNEFLSQPLEIATTTATPSSQSQSQSQHPSSNSNSRSRSMAMMMMDHGSQYGGGSLEILPTLLDTTNPFLPPHAIQRIIGPSSSSSSSLSSSSSSRAPNGNNELGKASLLEMNELSRRAAEGYLDLDMNGEDGNLLWSGMNFSVAGSSSSQGRKEGQVVDDSSNSNSKSNRGLERSTTTMDGNLVRRAGWENSNSNADDDDGGDGDGDGAEGNGFATKRSMSEERERVGFDVSMARDDSTSSIGMRVGEIQEGGRRGRRRGRQSDGNFLGRDDGYLVGSQEQQSQTPSLSSSSLVPSTGTRTSNKPQTTTVLDPWASLVVSGQPVVGMLDSVSQQRFNPGSNRGSMTEEDTHEGLQVYTVGHLLPKGIGIGGSEDFQGWWALDSETGNQSGTIFGDVAGDTGQAQQQQPPGGYQDATQFRTPSSTESDAGNEEEVVQPTPSNSLIIPDTTANLSSTSSINGSRKLRVRRSTYVPGWAVPPRVLLVDDDAVSRRLSSKFLKVFGCTIDVAVDGVGAVNKMNLEKYDLVLMDIVMPKLDGVSATNLIRKFDQGTPIISMTSNSKPNEIMTYYSSGMNDILPKPFTKEGLLDMLEKHLMHLKVIQQMSKLPRSISTSMFSQGFGSDSQFGLPPGNSSMIESSSSSAIAGSTQSSRNEPTGGVFTAGSRSTTLGFFNLGSGGGGGGGAQDGGGINLLAGMGLTDDQYTLILQNMLNGDGTMDESVNVSGSGGIMEKRALEDVSEDSGRRGRKRSRFEIIE